jgi:hypothetical protein
MSSDIISQPSPPRKPSTPFFLYLQENKEQLQKMYPESTPSEITAQIAEEYNKLTPEQRQLYEDRAASLKSEYETAKEDYIKKYGQLPKTAPSPEPEESAPEKKATKPHTLSPTIESEPKTSPKPENPEPKETQEPQTFEEQASALPPLQDTRDLLSPEATKADEMIGGEAINTETPSNLQLMPIPQEINPPQFEEPPKEQESELQASEQPKTTTPQNLPEKTQEQPGEETVSPQKKTPGKKGRKPKSEATTSKISESTHQALSKAGKKGAAKRWGKLIEKEEGALESTEEPTTSTKQQQKGHKQVDPEISHAFSKIGYMGGKARGGEDQKGPIDPETHLALSKAGKLGAAKRWGKVRESKGQPKEPVQGSHMMTRSQTSHTGSQKST